MTKHSLRPIAICVMLANGLPLLAQQPTSLAERLAPKANLAAAQQVAAATQVSFGAIEGQALDPAGSTISGANVRLRDINSGKVVDTKLTNETGAFSFKNVNPGKYVVEIVGSDDKVLAASKMLTLNAGEAVTASVSLPATAAGLTSLFSAPVAAVIIGSAAAAGVLAVQAGDCASPPCQ